MLNLDPGNKSMHHGVSRFGVGTLPQKSRQQKACCAADFSGVEAGDV
jgi:hypothetical protein